MGISSNLTKDIGDKKREELKNRIDTCKTKKQVLEVLKKMNLKYKVDEEMEQTALDNGTPKTKNCDLWVDKKTRIYFSKYYNYYVVQKWERYNIIKTGNKKQVPSCYGYFNEIDETIEVKDENW